MTPTLEEFAKASGLDILGATTDAAGNALYFFSWPMLTRLTPGKAAAFVTAIEWPDGGWNLTASITASSATAPAATQHARLMSLRALLDDARPVLKEAANGAARGPAAALLSRIDDAIGVEA